MPADALEARSGGVISSEQLCERVYEPHVDQLLEAGGEAGTTQCRRRQHWLPGGRVRRGHARQLRDRDGGGVVPSDLVRIRVRVRVGVGVVVGVGVRVRVRVGVRVSVSGGVVPAD